MIPNKSSFKFQELTPITGVKPYVIRFWETEFPEIDPISSEGGQKIYSRSDVENILKIKKLLFEDKLSIQEAKQRMSVGEVEVVEEESSHVEVPAIPAIPAVDVRPYLEKSLQLIQDIKFRRNW